MFRAEILQIANVPTLKLEGRLVGEWAEQAKGLVVKASVPKGIVVDLTDVSYVDSVGEQVLTWLGSVGAVFIAKAVYVASVCERLRLPLQGEPADSSERNQGRARRPSRRRIRAS